MNKKIVAIWLGLAMVLGFIVMIVEIATVVKAPTIIIVDGSGGGDYDTIQEAIDASLDGDTIRVYDGTYYETVMVNKMVNLIGNGSTKTIIDGGWLDHQNVVTIMVNWVNMSGFGVINSYMGHEFGGIGVMSSNNRIFDNHCWNNLYGAILWGDQNRLYNNSFSNNQRDGIFVKSSGNIIENNTCSNSINEDGIWLYICTDNIVSNNTCSNNYKNGISFFQSHNNDLFNNTCNNSILYDGVFIYESSNNELWNNTLSFNNGDGFGISHFSQNNTLFGNIITGNQIGGSIRDNSTLNTVRYNDASNNGGGIFLDSSNNNTIRGNTVSDSGYGMYLDQSSNNSIIGNQVLYNGDGISVTSTSSNNKIFHNNFFTNAVQAADYTVNGNQWDNGYPSGGNYWSDYDGIDLYSTATQDVPPSDGIGDTPYVIDPDSRDDFPLMSPFGNFTFLYEGWNLISIPLIQSDRTLGTSLISITGSYDAVQRYNASDSGDHWVHNWTAKPQHLNDMDRIEHTMGFWVHITEPGGVLFGYFGTQPMANQTIALHPGWNMVGYPSLIGYNRTTGLNNLTFGGDVDAIWWFDAAMKTWEFMEKDDSFVPCEGYWVHAINECEWEVPL